MPGKGNSLIESLQLDGQSLALQRTSKRDKCILRSKNIGITQPAHKPTVLDPRSPRYHVGRTMPRSSKRSIRPQLELRRQDGTRPHFARPAASPAKKITRQTHAERLLVFLPEETTVLTHTVRLKASPDQLHVDGSELVRIDASVLLARHGPDSAPVSSLV